LDQKVKQLRASGHSAGAGEGERWKVKGER
jgi:hypothetical protein